MLMKRFLLTMGVLLSLQVANADTIVTTAADLIDCQILLIRDNSVVYRKPGESFDREMERSKILKVKYDNGTEEILRTTPTAPLKGSDTRNPIPVRVYNGTDITYSGNTSDYETEPDWSQLPTPSRRYEIGDWYEENGIAGIVIWTTPDGLHGRILYPRIFEPKKIFFSGPGKEYMGMADYANGYANWQALKQFIATHPQYPEDSYPVYQLVESINGNWYIPAFKEQVYLDELFETKVPYNGPVEKFKGKNVKWIKVFNELAKSKNGKKLDNYALSITSTEAWDEGGASKMFESMYGDCYDPQFGLLKDWKNLENEKIVGKPTNKRFKYIKYYLFHLF